MTARMSEVDSQAELKESHLRVMELETQNGVIANQLKRQSEEVLRLRDLLEAKSSSEAKLEGQLRDARRQHSDLESRMKEDLMLARIRDAENTQSVAELTQKISSLEYKVKESRECGALSCQKRNYCLKAKTNSFLLKQKAQTFLEWTFMCSKICSQFKCVWLSFIGMLSCRKVIKSVIRNPASPGKSNCHWPKNL